MPSQKTRINITVAALLALVGLVLGVFISQQVHFHQEKNLSEFHGTLLDTPRDVSTFSLVGIDDKPFCNQQLKGRWTMMFFGFTNCGSICPTTMSELAKTYQLLTTNGVSELPKVVMVTLDPDRDSLVKLNQYVKAFNPNFYGARGDETAVEALAREMGIAYTKVALKSSSYNIEHTGTVMLFDPNGKLVAFFTTPHHATQLARDYQLLVS